MLPLVERLVAESMAASTDEDTGLWEYRTLPRHYTFSKVLCWVAASRGADMAERRGRGDLAAPWRAWADASASACSTAAYNEELGFFTQALDGRHPDASNLLLATIGFIDAHDPRFVSTVRAYEAAARATAGLMQRYNHADDFGDTTSTFTICSFWWAEALGDDRPRRRRRAAVRSAGRARQPARVSSRRTSSPRPGGCSATSRRPTPTSA